MQLKKRGYVKTAVATFAAALLGSGAMAGAQNSGIESSLLLYSETDRVKAAEGIVSYHRELSGGQGIGLKLTLDGLTGASPNGAAPTDRIQTFTRPSGNGSYQAQPGEIPLDDTFKDTRFALDGTFNQPLNRVTNLTLGGHFSGEHDYSSFGVNAGLTHDLFRRNTTVGLSASFSHDVISPEGGAPIPLSSMVAARDDDGGEDDEHEGGESEFEGEDDDGEGGGSSKSKDVFDILAGFSQVLDRKTIFRFNYSYSHSSGYNNDPYKIVSIVQNESGDTPGDPLDYIYENRPDTRTKQALYGQLRRYLGGHTVDLSYRYFWDDWGITSHTVDFYFKWNFKGGQALQPHVRWYHQNQADFYRTYLVDGDPMPQNVSADYRLATYDGLTLGLQYSFPVAEGSRLSLSAEHYSQTGDRSPPEAIGVLNNYDLFPDMKVIMFRLGFSHDF